MIVQPVSVGVERAAAPGLLSISRRWWIVFSQLLSLLVSFYVLSLSVIVYMLIVYVSLLLFHTFISLMADSRLKR